MLYKRPTDIKFVDMCIWIDNNAYRKDLSEEEQEKIYEYIYHLTKMLAYKNHLFNKGSYYEEFAIYSSTKTYLRLISPKQFELKEDGSAKLKKIKSILNYIKSVLYPHKVDFEQEFYSQVLDYNPQQDNLVDVSGYTFSDMLHEYTEDLDLVEFDLCLTDVCKTIKNFLSKIPYKKNTKEWHNIYVSCLLTLVNSITLSNAEKQRIKELKMSQEYKLKYIEKIYKKQCLDAPILFHLNNDMSSYIQVLVNGIRHSMSKELCYRTHTYIPSNSNMNKLILADINSEEYDYE